MRKAAASIFAAVALTALLSGCEYSNEINAMSLVMGIAIDKGERENEYEVTAQIARAEVLSGASSHSGVTSEEDGGFLNITMSGVGVSAALHEISQMVKREFYTGHIQVIVISREVAENGIAPILDYFIGSADGRMSTSLLIAKDKAKDLIENHNPMDHSPAANLSELIEAQKKIGEIGASTIAAFLSDMIGTRTAATIPVAEVHEDDNGTEFVEITGVAAFDGLKLKDVMTTKQSRAVIAVRDEITGGYLTVEKDRKYLMLHLEKTSSRVSAVINGGKPVFTVRIYREYSIEDATWYFDYLNDKERENAQQLAEAEALRLLDDTLSWAKSHHLDVFAFGEHLYRYHLKEAEKLLGNWQMSFPEIEVNFELDFTILGTGAILKNLDPDT